MVRSVSILAMMLLVFRVSSAFCPVGLRAQVAGKRTAFVSSPLQMSESNGNVPVVITGNNMEVTPALMDHVNKKMEKVLGKLARSGLIRECDVHLVVSRNPEVKNSHTAEVSTYLKGTTIRSTESTPDMYTSIDLVARKLARKLVKYKERRVQGFHGGPHMGDKLSQILEEIATDVQEDTALSTKGEEVVEEFEDPYEPEITRIKSFDLSKPISLKEAVFALDYIDHDFFVFRDLDSGLVSVVYKRNAGGVGLIQPQQ